MDYKDKYNEVFEKAKKVLLDCTPEEQNVVEYIFPELKVSKDEKIRQALIKYYSFDEDGHSHALDNITPEQIVAWLEKQGEQNLAKKYGITGIGSKHAEGKLGEMIKKKIETENVNNTNKVKSKFKDGDWIVYKDAVWEVCNIALQSCYELLKTNNEVTTRLIEDVDKEAHLWTIQDAKPGDVIYAVSRNNTFDFIYIFSEIKNESPWAYCSVNKDCENLGGDSRHWWFDNHEGSIELERYDFYPATKEQQNLLFEKMEEAGYMWDSKNIELQKIEQNTINKTEVPLGINGWVVRKDGETFHDKRKFAKITKIDEEGRYWLDCGTWIRPNEIRHWTINDAEDGDVLVYPSTSAGDKECPFIFKEIDKNGIVRFHAALIQNEALYIDDGVTNVLGYARRGYHIPATKEQRDILFQKMGEEAWEWDNEKKELKSHYKFIVTKDSKKGLEMTT